jgi:hypothetical protein
MRCRPDAAFATVLVAGTCNTGSGWVALSAVGVSRLDIPCAWAYQAPRALTMRGSGATPRCVWEEKRRCTGSRGPAYEVVPVNGHAISRDPTDSPELSETGLAALTPKRFHSKNECCHHSHRPQQRVVLAVLQIKIP